MPPAGLIDTGAILALINRRDSWHAACLEAYEQAQLPLLTSEAVLTETLHLSQRHLRQIRPVWTLVRSGAIQMLTIDNEELPFIQKLMEDYADCPMDFADATLVHLAAREGISTILTIDRDDFSTYRLPGRKKFTIFPQP